MRALERVRSWPVPNAAAAVVGADGTGIASVGAGATVFRLASVTKVLTAWSTLVAIEEGIVHLDDAVGQPGCTLRHLLAHAGGYPFEGDDPVAAPQSRRIYSNTGIELVARHVEQAAGVAFADYLAESVTEPLVMASTELRGSPAHAVWSSVADLCSLLAELQSPRLIHRSTASDAVRTHYPGLAGIVPAMGRFDPCPWGLGVEVRGDKSPHWTGTTNSPATYGHFGAAGTMLWVDPAAGVGLVALTDRSFDDWAVEAKRSWRELSDAVVADVGTAGAAG